MISSTRGPLFMYFVVDAPSPCFPLLSITSLQRRNSGTAVQIFVVVYLPWFIRSTFLNCCQSMCDVPTWQAYVICAFVWLSGKTSEPKPVLTRDIYIRISILYFKMPKRILHRRPARDGRLALLNCFKVWRCIMRLLIVNSSIHEWWWLCLNCKVLGHYLSLLNPKCFKMFCFFNITFGCAEFNFGGCQNRASVAHAWPVLMVAGNRFLIQ